MFEESPFELAAAATGATFSCCCVTDVPFDFSPFKESLNFPRPRGMVRLLIRSYDRGIRRDQWPEAKDLYHEEGRLLLETGLYIDLFPRLHLSVIGC